MILQRGDHDIEKATLYGQNQLLPILKKLIGTSSVERIGYYLKNCTSTLLTINAIDINSDCISAGGSTLNHENQNNITFSCRATTSSTTLFYSPAFDRHIPLFGLLGNHKGE